MKRRSGQRRGQGDAGGHRLMAALRGAVLPALAIMVVAFFGGYALFGANGVMAWGGYRQQLTQKQQELFRLERQKIVLANRVKLLDPKAANPDMVDELVRRQLGVAHPDEVIVPLP